MHAASWCSVMADENLLTVCYSHICDMTLTYVTLERLGYVRS